ncbi:hypothetical protein ACFX13_031052 [Malus domestica]
MPDAFNDAMKVTKSHIPVANAPARIDVHVEQNKVAANYSSGARLKRGRSPGSKDSTPRKRKTMAELNPNEIIQEERMNDKSTIHDSGLREKENVLDETHVPEETVVHDSKEISINYACTNELWDQNEIIIDDMFAFEVATEIILNDDIEPRFVDECKQRQDRPKWKDAIQAELNSLERRNVFGSVVQTPPDVNPVGYKWVFIRKRNEKNEIVGYKARLVAQGFSQRPGIDYEETYSPIMDAITFRYLISLVVSEKLDMRLMDVITAYLYGELDTNIYMKVPEGLKLPETTNKPRGMLSIKLRRSLYGLKQSGRMWYNRLSEYLIKEGYINNVICPYVFIKKSNSGFAIVAVYVDDMNLVGTPEELNKTAEYLKSEFEMKDLGKIKYCLGLQIEHCANGILVHQLAYIEKNSEAIWHG